MNQRIIFDSEANTYHLRLRFILGLLEAYKAGSL